jgi:lipoate-protein ligase A
LAHRTTALPSPVIRRGSASELHSIEPDGSARAAWWMEVERPAVVLGSTQRLGAVDADACRVAGVDVVRRRSGGGAVLMLPDEIMWLDVVVPRNDLHWDDDVGRSMWWFGEVWAGALDRVGVERVDVHRTTPLQTAWSRTVCFDGIGSGEVTVDGVKAVGISQRRTREWARLQSAVHLRWRPDLLTRLLTPPAPAPTDLADVWTLPAALAAAVRERVDDLLGCVTPLGP